MNTNCSNCAIINACAQSLLKLGDFLDDDEKMADFFVMSKEDFLNSYSYLTEEEYDNTKNRYELSVKNSKDRNAEIVAKALEWIYEHVSSSDEYRRVLKENLGMTDSEIEIIGWC